MALQPLDRPVGSSHILRYVGAVIPSAQTAATYPQLNATIASDSATGPITGTPTGQYSVWVRFALFDPTNLTNPLRQFPSFVYDDSNPAGVSPHAPVASVPSTTPGINASDLSIAAKTWAPNLHIAVSALDSLSITCDIEDARVLLDSGANSGLGLNSGLPVIALRFNVLQGANPVLQSFNIDVTFEIRHSTHR